MRPRIGSTIATIGLGLMALVAGATVGWSHSGNDDPNQIHAGIGNVSKVVRIVSVTGNCVSQPKSQAETAMHWPATTVPRHNRPLG